MDFGYRETVVRPRGGQVLAVLVAAICAAGLVGLALAGQPGALLHGAFPLGLVAVGTWSLFWRPLVRLTPAELEIVNPLRTIRIGWPAVEDVETRWSLTVVAGGRRWAAWAAPREGAIGSGRRRRARYGRAAVGSARVEEEGGPFAGVLARRQWQEYRDRGLLGAVEGPGVVVTWHVRSAVVLTLLAAGTVATALLP